MKELTIQGIGTDTKHANPVLPPDEAQLWDSGVFNTETASGISNIVFFYNCKLFGFRGMDNGTKLLIHHSFLYQPTRVVLNFNYTGRLCKNIWSL